MTDKLKGCGETYHVRVHSVSLVVLDVVGFAVRYGAITAKPVRVTATHCRHAAR